MSESSFLIIFLQRKLYNLGHSNNLPFFPLYIKYTIRVKQTQAFTLSSRSFQDEVRGYLSVF